MGDTATVDIYDPDWYLTDEVHATFDRLRATERVHWQEIPGDTGYWAVLSHPDVVTVARNPELFSAALGGIMLESADEATLTRLRNMLLAMDPPQHLVYRRPLAPHFLPAVVGRMTEQIRARCRAIMERAAEQGDVDLVHDVAGPLPAQVIAAVMGLPHEDTPMLQRWAEIQTGGQDAEVLQGYEGNASVEMAQYGIARAAERRGGPRRDDLTSLLLETTFEDGTTMTEAQYGSFFVQLVTAGNDTTKTAMSAGVHELLARPDQLQALRDDPTLIPLAVEEMVRFCNPLHYFRRTATADTELGGQQIRAGHKVAMMYTAANRDPAVFDDPHRFDIRRTPNPHLSFGIGEHFCLGVHLARLEIRIFLEELLGTFAEIEPLGPPVKIRSNLNNGYRRMPVRLHRHPRRAS